ncbi:RNA helicase, partial [Tulasnella sp. 427]
VAISPILSGRDVVVQGHDGLGKTSAAAIALLQKIDVDVKEAQALVLSPTRELATHVHLSISSLGGFTNIRSYASVGSSPLREEIRKLDEGVHAVSGTPGRVLDMLNRKKLKGTTIKLLVLNAADELLNGDRSFKKELHEIHGHLHPEVQVVHLCVESPTIFESSKIPITIRTVTREVSWDDVKQYILQVGPHDQGKTGALYAVFNAFTVTQAVIFCNSKTKVSTNGSNLKKY